MKRPVSFNVNPLLHLEGEADITFVKETLLILDITAAKHRVYWKRFIDIYLWMLGKGSALDSLRRINI